MKNYLALMQDILDNGHNHEDRTGVGRRTVFAPQLRFDLSTGEFPLITTRKLPNPLLPIAEILFFIGGHTNVEWLHQHNLKFWDGWAVKKETAETFVQKLVKNEIIAPEMASVMMAEFMGNPDSAGMIGEIGPMYGHMWRCWPIVNPAIPTPVIRRTVDQLPSDLVATLKRVYTELPDDKKALYTEDQWLLLNYYSSVDQLNELVWNLKQDPFSSRHLVTAFNPELTPVPGYSPDENVLMKKGCLMPCHFSFQCVVTPPQEKGKRGALNLKVGIRSADVPVGTPANVAGYAFLLCLLAHCCDFERGELVVEFGDAHIYLDQIELAKEQVQRTPTALPRLWLNPEKRDLFAFTMDDVRIENYEPHPEPIKYPVAV